MTLVVFSDPFDTPNPDSATLKSACVKPVVVKGAVDNAKNEWLVRRYLDLNDDTDGRSGGKSFWQTVVDLKRGLQKLPHKPPRPSKNLMGPFAEPTPRL